MGRVLASTQRWIGQTASIDALNCDIGADRDFGFHRDTSAPRPDEGRGAAATRLILVLRPIWWKSEMTKLSLRSWHGGVMSAGEGAHDFGPDARSPPANEAIVTSGVRAEVVRHVAPWRPRSQDPEDAIEDATVIHPWHDARLGRQHRLDGSSLIVGEFVAHDSAL